MGWLRRAKIHTPPLSPKVPVVEIEELHVLLVQGCFIGIRSRDLPDPPRRSLRRSGWRRFVRALSGDKKASQVCAGQRVAVSAFLPHLVLTAYALTGSTACSRTAYREDANREAYEVIAERNSDPRWAVNDYRVDVDPRSRFFDPHDPDRPPMPPDDPDSQRYMEMVAGYKSWSRWQDNGVLDDIESLAWREALSEYVDLDESGAVVLDADSALTLAYLHSPFHQRQRETLYLSALDVTRERFRLSTQFFGGYDLTYTKTEAGSVAVAGRESEGNPALSARRAFSAGADLLVGIANSFVFELASDDPSFSLRLSGKAPDRIERFLLDRRHASSVSRIADDEQQKRLFVLWAFEKLVQKAHRCGCVGEGRESGVMESGDEHAGGDADRLVGVVVLDDVAVGVELVALRKDRDQVGRDFEKRLRGVRTQGLQGVEPRLWSTMGVERFLFFLRRGANLPLHCFRFNDDKMPRLQVGAARRRCRGPYARVDDVAGWPLG